MPKEASKRGPGSVGAPALPRESLRRLRDDRGSVRATSAGECAVTPSQKANRSESCKFRARGLLLVIIPNWLDVGFRNPPTEQFDWY